MDYFWMEGGQINKRTALIKQEKIKFLYAEHLD